MKYIVIISILTCFYISKAQIGTISLVLKKETVSEYILNNLYFGNNNDIVAMRGMLIAKQQPVMYGYIRFKYLLKKELFLLLHTEYMEMNGYCLAPIIGMRKLF